MIIIYILYWQIFNKLNAKIWWNKVSPTLTKQFPITFKPSLKFKIKHRLILNATCHNNVFTAWKHYRRYFFFLFATNNPEATWNGTEQPYRFILVWQTIANIKIAISAVMLNECLKVASFKNSCKNKKNIEHKIVIEN